MKRVIALVLVAVLALGLLVLPASAEAVKEGDTVDGAVLTIGEGEIVKADDTFTIEEYGEDSIVKAEGEPIEEYNEEIVKAEGEPIQEYGFFAWLKNIWKSILSFFGL